MQDWEQHFLEQSLATVLRYPKLAKAQQYVVSPEITKFCFEVWRAHESIFTGDGRAVSPVPVPSEDLLLFVSDELGQKVTPLHVVTKDDESRIWILSGDRRDFVGGFLRSGDVLKESVSLAGVEHGEFGYFVSLVISIITQPRFVVEAPLGYRQVRRRLETKYGFSVEKLHKITWQIGEASPAGTASVSARRLPLHFRRGHWREAKAHYHGAEFVRLGPPHAIREGHFQWIKEQWPGHPAFGVRLSVHAPKLNVAGFGENADED